MHPDNIGSQFSYRGSHQPSSDFGAPLHDLTGGGEIYPEDVYSKDGGRIYSGYDKTALKDHQTAVSYRNQPEKPITIYRAVPKGVKDINPGDWVAISHDYAKLHGEGRHGAGNYNVVSKTVPAKHLITPGDSLSEWGYYPN
jgi:hypothetical protein